MVEGISHMFIAGPPVVARAGQTLTKEELGELITHLAFYSGWPTAVTAASIAKEVFDKRS